MNTQPLGLGTLIEPPAKTEPPPTMPRPNWSFLVTMAIVAVLAAIYYGLIATPMYVSTTRFTINSQSAGQPTTSMLIGLGLSGAATGVPDMVAVQDHLQSPQVLDALDKKYHLREAYTHFRIDPFHWLSPWASKETFLNFYNNMVTIELDREADIVEVDVRSFDQASAQPMAQSILEESANFVDGMSQTMRNDTVKNAKIQLAKAQKDAEDARAALTNFRGTTSAVDSTARGEEVLSGEAAIESQVAGAQADLASAESYNAPNSPLVKQMRARLVTLQQQLEAVKGVQSTKGPVSKQVTGYETLVIQRTTAEAGVTTAQAALDAANALADQRQKYVVRVEDPTSPDKPAEPQKVRDFFMVMIFALAGYAIISLLVAGIRDHRGV